MNRYGRENETFLGAATQALCQSHGLCLMEIGTRHKKELPTQVFLQLPARSKVFYICEKLVRNIA